MTSRAGVVAILVSLVACAGPRLPSLPSDFAPDENEEGIWMLSAEVERDLERWGTIHEPALEHYLEGVLRRLLPGGTPDRFRPAVRVLDSAEVNAFALADGRVYVSASILAELDDEAQVATLLGHEISHVLLRHAYGAWVAANRDVGLKLATQGLSRGAQVAMRASYARDQEREADKTAFALLIRAGYAPAQAPVIFQRLDRIAREEEKPGAPDPYRSHPELAERIRRTRELARAAPSPQAGEVGAERYRAAIRPILLRAARLAFAEGKVARAERVARSMNAEAPNADAWVLLGDISRFAGADPAEAVRRYRQALAVDPYCADALRGLGRALIRVGDRAGAREALQRYQVVRANAVDRAFVEADLLGLLEEHSR